MITAARNAHGDDPVGSHAHPLNARTSVVPGATMAEQHAKIGDWAPLADALGRSKTPVFADLGHLHASSPVVGLAARADVVVVVSRPDMPSIVRLRERLIRLASDLARLRGAAPNLFPLLLSMSRHGHADVADLRTILAETPANPFLVGTGFLALDPAAVRRLEAGEDPAGRLSRTDLLRSAQAVTRQLEQLLGPDSRREASALRGLS